MTIKQSIKLSAIIDKMGLKIEDANASQEKLGADFIMQIVKNAYKAETEILDFVIASNKCTLEEAEEVDIVVFVKEIMKTSGISDFLKSAVKPVKHK